MKGPEFSQVYSLGATVLCGGVLKVLNISLLRNNQIENSGAGTRDKKKFQPL